jgi:hypothetical protein
MGLFGPKNAQGNKYGFVIVDDLSRFTWVFFLNDKSKVSNIFKSFIKRNENEFELKIKKVWSDNESGLYYLIASKHVS